MILSAFTKRYNKIENKLISEVVVEPEDRNSKFKPVIAIAQWDTGATGTCISREVAKKLGLKEFGFGQITTPSGSLIVPRYLINLVINQEVRIYSIPVYASEIGDQEIDILIGMNVITLGDLAVTNYQGITQFSFRLPTQEHISFAE